MNHELLLSLCCGIAGFSAVLAATLYTIGGRDNTPKAIRRFGSPICVLGGIISILSITSRLTLENAAYAILASIALCIGYCMGYGGDKIWTKIKKRLAIALVYIVAFLFVSKIFPYNQPKFIATLIMHSAMCLSTVYLGVKNPLNAASEEFHIGLFSCLMICMYTVG